jgi:hypothetical protein
MLEVYKKKRRRRHIESKNLRRLPDRCPRASARTSGRVPRSATTSSGWALKLVRSSDFRAEIPNLSIVHYGGATSAQEVYRHPSSRSLGTIDMTTDSDTTARARTSKH